MNIMPAFNVHDRVVMYRLPTKEEEEITGWTIAFNKYLNVEGIIGWGDYRGYSKVDYPDVNFFIPNTVLMLVDTSI